MLNWDILQYSNIIGCVYNIIELNRIYKSINKKQYPSKYYAIF